MRARRLIVVGASALLGATIACGSGSHARSDATDGTDVPFGDPADSDARDSPEPEVDGAGSPDADGDLGDADRTGDGSDLADEPDGHEASADGGDEDGSAEEGEEDGPDAATEVTEVAEGDEAGAEAEDEPPGDVDAEPEPDMEDSGADLDGEVPPESVVVTPSFSILWSNPGPCRTDPWTVELTATAWWSDGSNRNVTLEAEWRSNHPEAASVDSSGVVTPSYSIAPQDLR